MTAPHSPPPSRARKVSPDDVDVRYFRENDLDDYCNYFFRSPPGFLEGIGLRPEALGSEDSFRQSFLAHLKELNQNGPPSKFLLVLFQGEKVGFHLLTHINGNDSAIMHAHFFRPEYRGLGIGTISYVKAMEVFMRDFGFKEIVFKTPMQNRAPMRIKEKLGLQPLGEEVLDWPSLQPGTRAQLFRVDRQTLKQIKTRLGIG